MFTWHHLPFLEHFINFTWHSMVPVEATMDMKKIYVEGIPKGTKKEGSKKLFTK